MACLCGSYKCRHEQQRQRPSQRRTGAETRSEKAGASAMAAMPVAKHPVQLLCGLRHADDVHLRGLPLLSVEERTRPFSACMRLHEVKAGESRPRPLSPRTERGSSGSLQQRTGSSSLWSESNVCLAPCLLD
ncbi:hypothetical protein HPB50_013236 [Hyalomma asiaticum]|uniref:Uncharacterized protein n=1 Tax=Hyalomma asiaticum TaxID=266040 RepID=A0ACB7TM09_HYAAI|nr:hypothetical protein HPB50_013236 [Hyalomma asiaticum]